MTRRLAALGVAAALALPAPAAAQETKSKCSAAKLKAVGAYHAALASCAAKAVVKDLSLDPFCVTKAQVKLAARFEKAEKKDDCRTWREAISIQEILDGGFADVLEILEPPPSVCCANNSVCLWVPDADACASVNGEVGAPGTVCSSDACVPPPAVDGPCCEGVVIPGEAESTCLSSPTLLEADCTSLGGSFVGDAVCLPGRVCID